MQPSLGNLKRVVIIICTGIREAIELCLEVEQGTLPPHEFIGVQRVAVEV